MKLPKPVTMKVADIKPYENNPRIISEKSREAVRMSIEKYGYVQPIVTDLDGVIIAGHTRHQALVEMGVKSVKVYKVDMPAEKARALRIVDNRVGEMSDWDRSALTMELREMEDGVLAAYFWDVDLELGQLRTAMREVTEDEIGQATEHVSSIPERQRTHTTDVECPACRGVFQTKTATLGVTPEDLELLLARDEE